MIISTPRAPWMEITSSGRLETACSAASPARFSPEDSPVPILAMPISAMTARTSAKSTLSASRQDAGTSRRSPLLALPGKAWSCALLLMPAGHGPSFSGRCLDTDHHRSNGLNFCSNTADNHCRSIRSNHLARTNWTNDAANRRPERRCSPKQAARRHGPANDGQSAADSRNRSDWLNESGNGC